jgi:hypothetical protein
MTAKAAITLADAGDTPESPGTPAVANRVFTPGAMENGNVHTFYNSTTGVTPATKSKMTVSLTPLSTTRNTSRVKIAIAAPKSQTVDGIVQVAHINRGFVEFVFDKNSTRDDRRDLKELVKQSLNDAGILGMIADGEDLY